VKALYILPSVHTSSRCLERFESVRQSKLPKPLSADPEASRSAAGRHEVSEGGLFAQSGQGTCPEQYSPLAFSAYRNRILFRRRSRRVLAPPKEQFDDWRI
jgi:hypothetical protein